MIPWGARDAPKSHHSARGRLWAHHRDVQPAAFPERYGAIWGPAGGVRAVPYALFGGPPRSLVDSLCWPGGGFGVLWGRPGVPRAAPGGAPGASTTDADRGDPFSEVAQPLDSSTRSTRRVWSEKLQPSPRFLRIAPPVFARPAIPKWNFHFLGEVPDFRNF